MTIAETIRRKALTAAMFSYSLRRSDSQVPVSTSYWDKAPLSDFNHLINHLGEVNAPERRKIREILKRFEVQSILDAGCGPASEFASYQTDPLLKNAQYLGLDLSSRMLKTAKERFPDINLVRADLSRTPFPNTCFDAVVLRHVLEHQPDGYRQIVREAVRVAKKCVVIDFFHKPLPLIPETLRVNDKKGFSNNWYNRDIFQAFLDSLPLNGWFVTNCPGTAKQEAAIYTLLI